MADSLLPAIRRSVIGLAAVIFAGSALMIAPPNARAASAPVLTIESASRICPDLDGFFHLDVTITGDAPNAGRELSADIGQHYAITSYPALTTNNAGVLPVTNVVMANRLDYQIVDLSSVTINLLAYGDPTQRVLAHTTIVVPPCAGPTVETVSCTDHSHALGSPTCVGSPDANYSKYAQVSGSVGTAAQEFVLVCSAARLRSGRRRGGRR